ncbi:MAG: hypothetical protein J0L58_19025 [Burkholderiales bacterium]|nr:hypothetical protein [Burkholderiales bacterium]
MTLALLQRRALLLQAAAAGGLGAGAAAAAPASASAPTPPPGRPGDFDFLTGEWRIHNRRPKAEGGFDEFPGEATVIRLLDGAASIEELRIPAKGFSGLGLRFFDPKAQLWRDIWMNAKHGIAEGPGMPGHFVDGAGIFEADDKDGETPIKVRGIWDQITPRSCRWRQGVSRDGGRTWTFNWWMDWTRV